MPFAKIFNEGCSNSHVYNFISNIHHKIEHFVEECKLRMLECGHGTATLNCKERIIGCGQFLQGLKRNRMASFWCFVECWKHDCKE